MPRVISVKYMTIYATERYDLAYKSKQKCKKVWSYKKIGLVLDFPARSYSFIHFFLMENGIHPGIQGLER